MIWSWSRRRSASMIRSFDALEVVKRMKWGVVVAILPDRGEKYLSTPLWGFPDDPVVNAPVG